MNPTILPLARAPALRLANATSIMKTGMRMNQPCIINAIATSHLAAFARSIPMAIVMLQPQRTMMKKWMKSINKLMRTRIYLYIKEKDIVTITKSASWRHFLRVTSRNLRHAVAG